MAQQATTNDEAALIPSQVQDENVPPQIPTPNTRPSLTEEQKERMLKNRQLAEEKRRRRKEGETAASLQIDSSSGNGLVKSATDYSDAVTGIKGVDKGNEIDMEISEIQNMTPLTDKDKLTPTKVMKVASVDPNESLSAESVTVFSQDQTEKRCSANGEDTLATDFSEKATLATESVDKAT